MTTKYILDCTLRDGGYINNWRFDDNFITEYIKCMNYIGTKYVEIGFINKFDDGHNTYREQIVGQVRHLDSEHIKKFYSSNINFDVVVMADFKEINMDILIDPECMNIIKLVRIAFHKKDLDEALLLCNKVKMMGYSVSANAMGITNYSSDEMNHLLESINNYGIDILYIADSYGSLSNKELNNITSIFHSKLKNSSIGIHLHNNMQNAYSNFESIIDDYRITIIDTTLNGMGRGAGNLQTELAWISLMERNNISCNENLLKLLYFIQDYIKVIYGDRDNKWGYDLDYLLSGYLKMHPNYVSKMRDLNIKMNHRLFLLTEITGGSYFDIDELYDLIGRFKLLIL